MWLRASATSCGPVVQPLQAHTYTVMALEDGVRYHERVSFSWLARISQGILHCWQHTTNGVWSAGTWLPVAVSRAVRPLTHRFEAPPSINQWQRSKHRQLKIGKRFCPESALQTVPSSQVKSRVVSVSCCSSREHSERRKKHNYDKGVGVAYTWLRTAQRKSSPGLWFVPVVASKNLWGHKRLVRWGDNLDRPALLDWTDDFSNTRWVRGFTMTSQQRCRAANVSWIACFWKNASQELTWTSGSGALLSCFLVSPILWWALVICSTLVMCWSHPEGDWWTGVCQDTVGGLSTGALCGLVAMTLRSTSTLHTPRPRGKLVGGVSSISTKEAPAPPSHSFYFDFNPLRTVSRLTRTSDTDRANSWDGLIAWLSAMLRCHVDLSDNNVIVKMSREQRRQQCKQSIIVLSISPKSVTQSRDLASACTPYVLVNPLMRCSWSWTDVPGIAAKNQVSGSNGNTCDVENFKTWHEAPTLSSILPLFRCESIQHPR